MITIWVLKETSASLLWNPKDRPSTDANSAALLGLILVFGDPLFPSGAHGMNPESFDEHTRGNCNLRTVRTVAAASGTIRRDTHFSETEPTDIALEVPIIGAFDIAESNMTYQRPHLEGSIALECWNRHELFAGQRERERERERE